MNIRVVLVLLTWVLCCFCIPVKKMEHGIEHLTNNAGTEEVANVGNGWMPDSTSNVDRSGPIMDDAYSSGENSIEDHLNSTEHNMNPKTWFPEFDSALAGEIAKLTEEIKLFGRNVAEKLNEFASELGLLLKHVSRSALEFATIIEDFRGYFKEWESLLFERVSNGTQIFLDNLENSVFGLLSDIRRYLQQLNRILERTLNDIEERLSKAIDLLIELLTRLIDVHLDNMFESLGSILRSLSILLILSIAISSAILALLLLVICSMCLDIYSKCTSHIEVKKDDSEASTERSIRSLEKLNTIGAPKNTKMERDVEFTKMDDSTWEEAGANKGSSKATKTKLHLRKSLDVEFFEMDETTLQTEKTSSLSYEDPLQENRRSSKANKTKSGEQVHFEFMEILETTLQVEKTSSVSYEDTIEDNRGSSTANTTKSGEKEHLMKSRDVEFIAMDEMTLQVEQTSSVSYEHTVLENREEGPEESISKADAGTANGLDKHSM